VADGHVLVEIMMKKVILLFIAILITGLLIPAKYSIPVQNATSKDWNKHSYWFYPWGESGVHKGIDIFAKKGTPALASTAGIVIFKGSLARGGNAVAVLGPKWRIHYYAHLKSHDVHVLEWVSSGEKIGEVGDTGNAKGKPPHLHFSILNLIPNPAEITLETQGWKRMFYINPNIVLKS
jgi:murein DD-endopeptidase MepM/ murein hydrolase activator NlpD